jgi:glycerol-3-phosphate dehydrogenase
VLQRQAPTIARRYGWSRAMLDHLLHRYGSMLPELLEMVDADRSLGDRVKGAPAYLRVEIAYAVTHEGALHLDDVFMHRTRLNYEQADRGLGAIEEIADIVAPLLGWDDATRAEEIAAYTARAEAEAAAELEPDDASAQRARRSARDITVMRELAGAV